MDTFSAETDFTHTFCFYHTYKSNQTAFMDTFTAKTDFTHTFCFYHTYKKATKQLSRLHSLQKLISLTLPVFYHMYRSNQTAFTDTFTAKTDFTHTFCFYHTYKSNTDTFTAETDFTVTSCFYHTYKSNQTAFMVTLTAKTDFTDTSCFLPYVQKQPNSFHGCNHC